jgi:hypothetical protein
MDDTKLGVSVRSFGVEELTAVLKVIEGEGGLGLGSHVVLRSGSVGW